MFVVNDGHVDTIDERPTTGLFFDEGTGRWLRATSARELSSVVGEVIEYSGSPRGVRVRCLATVLDAHDVLLTPNRCLAVSTLDNSLVELGGRRPRSVHVLPGEPDSWHFNCVADVQGELFASAFRRGGTFRQWAENPYGSGCVFSLATGGVVADGLSMPHSPRLVDGLWLICDSARNDLIEVDPEHPSERVRTVGLGGYTRGLDLDDDHLYVGISPERKNGVDASATASLAIVDRKSWNLVDRVPVACPEVYDVRLVPKWAIRMLETPVPESRITDGRDLATAERPSGSTVGSTGIPAGLSVRFVPPKNVHTGDVFHVSTRVEHSGSAPLVASRDHPAPTGLPLDRTRRGFSRIDRAGRAVANPPPHFPDPGVASRCRCCRSGPRGCRSVSTTDRTCPRIRPLAGHDRTRSLLRSHPTGRWSVDKMTESLSAMGQARSRGHRQATRTRQV